MERLLEYGVGNSWAVGIYESSFGVASFGVLSENGAMVGFGACLRCGCLGCESRRSWQHCFLFTKNRILPHISCIWIFAIFGGSSDFFSFCIVHLDLLHFTAYQVIFVDIWLAVLYRRTLFCCLSAIYVGRINCNDWLIDWLGAHDQGSGGGGRKQ